MDTSGDPTFVERLLSEWWASSSPSVSQYYLGIWHCSVSVASFSPSDLYDTAHLPRSPSHNVPVAVVSITFITASISTIVTATNSPSSGYYHHHHYHRCYHFCHRLILVYPTKTGKHLTRPWIHTSPESLPLCTPFRFEKRFFQFVPFFHASYDTTKLNFFFLSSRHNHMIPNVVTLPKFSLGWWVGWLVGSRRCSLVCQASPTNPIFSTSSSFLQDIYLVDCSYTWNSFWREG